MKNKLKNKWGGNAPLGFALICIFVGVCSLAYVLYLRYVLNLPIPFGGHYVPPFLIVVGLSWMFKIWKDKFNIRIGGP